MIVSIIKKQLQNSGATSHLYVLARDTYHRAKKLKLYRRDAWQTWRDMRWRGEAGQNYWSMSSELLFQYHKLEKGLSMPGPKRFFGYDPAAATMRILGQWKGLGFSTENRIYRGAVATLHAYRQRLDITPPEQGELLLKGLSAALSEHGPVGDDVSTPQSFQALQASGQSLQEAFKKLVHSRRSVRDFDTYQKIPRAIVSRAVELAQLSPSACNRQPWRVHVYDCRERIDALLRYQDGNRGFGHTVPLLLVLCADARCFFDASERNEPYVDGGLFAMSLMLALQSQGISTCCLNWCVGAEQDKAAHELGGLDPSERIVMFMAVGIAATEAVVPRSPRRPVEDVLTFHSKED